MEQASQRRNRLAPWYIGILIILASITFIGYGMWTGICPAPSFWQIAALVVIPVVYLALMYLTFISQD